MAKCSPAAARSLPGGTWRGPGGSLRHPKSIPWSPKSGQGDPIGCQEAPRSTPERQKRRQKRAKIAFRMENVDFLKSILFPRKNYSFACPRAPKSHQNRAQTPSQTNLDDILRPKIAPRLPKSRPKPKKMRQKAGSNKRSKKHRFLDPRGGPRVFDPLGGACF